LFLVSFYLAKYVALGVAFVPIYLTIINGLTHVIAGIALTATRIRVDPRASLRA